MQKKKNQTRDGRLKKYFNRAALAVITALTLGLWTPQLASAIPELEPNDIKLQAQDVTDLITLSSDPNVTSSDTIPHVSIQGTGDGTFDFYTFTSLGGIIILDIDNTNASNDTFVVIWDSAGTIIAWNDDFGGDLGSTNNFDSFMFLQEPEQTIPGGTYWVGVCKFLCGPLDNFYFSQGSNSQQTDDIYTLHISARVPISTDIPTPTPEPSAMILLGSGLAGLAAFRRRHEVKKRDAWSC